MNTKALALSALLVVAGCQATPQAPLAPNSFTFDASRQQTKEAIVATYMERGFQITRESDLQLVMDRPASDSFGAQLLFGSQWNGVPNARLTLTLLGDNPTKVTANQAIVTNPGTAFERITDLSNNPDARTQLQIGMGMAIATARGQTTTTQQRM